MKKGLLHIVILLSFLVMHESIAQTACFTTDVARGCPPLSVNFTNCSAAGVQLYNYGDGTANTTSTSHTYTSTGTFIAYQMIPISGGGIDTFKVQIEVLTQPLPIFTVEICQGRTVRVVTNNLTYDEYDIDWGDGSPLSTSIIPPSTTSYTYADILPKTITVHGKYNPGTPYQCGASNATTITPLLALIKPDISSVTVNNQHATLGEITIKFTAVSSQKYRLEQSINNNTTYAPIATLSAVSGVQNFIVNSLNTSSNQYCYRIAAHDDCANDIFSEEICSLINTVTASNNQNDVSWNNHIPGNVTTYDVFLNSNPVAASSQPASPYTDAAVTCGATYCYSVTAQLNQLDGSGNNLQSISDDQCVNAISTNIPPAITDLNSTFEYYVNQLYNGMNYEDIINLNWSRPSGAKSYEILRSVNGSAFTSYATFNSPPLISVGQIDYFQDRNVSVPGNIYCYQIKFSDDCNNISPASSTTCPIVLDLAIDNTDFMLNHLSWSAYTGTWPLVYIIEILDENYNLYQTINVGSATSYTFNVTGTNWQTVRYRIAIDPTGIAGFRPSYSNLMEIKYKGEVFLPNAFTPDGDGTNDIFMAKGKFIKDFKMTIFNRWGEVVYSGDRFDSGWDGTYKGIQALNDAYAYLIQATDFWGKNITQRGSVTLLK